MIKRTILIAIILVIALAAIPPQPAASQSGYVWLPVWQAFTLTNTSGADIDLMPYVQNVCPGSVGGLMIYWQGKVSINGTEQTTNDGWRMLNSIDASSTTANNMRNAFYAWYITNGDGFSFSSGMSNYSYGGLSTFYLRDGYTDEANRLAKGSQLYELYVYCQASAIDFTYRDRFSVVDVPELSGSKPVGFYNNDLITACSGVSETSKPIGVLVHAGPQGQFANLFTAGTYWNVEFLDTWQSGHVSTYKDFMYSKMNEYIGETITVLRQNAATGGWIAHNVGVISNPITFHAGYALCFDTDPNFGIIADCSNVLYDGGMEQQPLSYFWFPEPSSTDNRYAFGRLDSNPLSAGAVFGSAICGEGQQVIGNMDCWPSLSWLQCQFFLDKYADIRQRFYWPGGKLYWEYSVKGRAQDNWDRGITYRTYVKNMSTQDIYLLEMNSAPNGVWVTRTGNGGTIPAGDYTFYIVLGTGNTLNDSFIVDDVIASPCPLDGLPCTIVQPAATQTPLAQTLTPTPSGMAGPNLIENCGFAQGETGWRRIKYQPPDTYLQPYYKSYVIYGIDNYGHAEWDAPQPGWAQDFYWPGGIAYVSWKSDTDYNVYFRNTATGVTYLAESGNYPYAGWKSYYKEVALPAGPYSINLHHPLGAGPSQYDNITVSAGNFTSCTAGSNATPTLQPTATQPGTATMFPTNTRQPTSTTLPGTGTATPIPSFTPYPTYTPKPPDLATRTATAIPTWTMLPTYTQQPTYTPYADYTPPPGNLLPSPPPPPQPPPQYFAPCRRPDNGYDVADWIEYDRCMILSYFDMSPNAVSTMVAMDGMFSGREPWGTIDEAQDTLDTIGSQLGQYDWQGDLPGKGNQPDINTFLPGEDSPWITGTLLRPIDNTAQPNMVCETALTDALGPLLAQGICWFFNILADTGVTPWLQLIINLGALGLLLVYIWRLWVNAGAGS